MYTPPLAARKFTLQISDDEYAEFQQLIRLSRLGPQTWDNSFEDGRYGISRTWLEQAKTYWLNDFDWRAQEARINSFSNYKINVEDEKGDVALHFVGLWSSRPAVPTVVLLHGWPGSFLEFLPTLELLKERRGEDLPFNIIVPSLPGYTLSSGLPLGEPWAAADGARIVNAALKKLGVDKYIVQRGDVGSWIASLLVTTYDSVEGIHLNLLPTLDRADASDPELSVSDKTAIDRAKSRFLAPTSGAAIMNSTRPATISAMRHSSPMALLSWMGEKLLEWPERPFSLDEILTNVSLWWLTDGASRCIYTYRTTYLCDHTLILPYIEKPFGFSWFMHELAPAPKKVVERRGRLVFHRQHEKGGHFAALERPAEFLDDLLEFVDAVLGGDNS